MSFSLTVIRPEETLPRFRDIDALLADCPQTQYPEVLTPEGIAAWIFFARQTNAEWNRAHLGQQGWKRDARRMKAFEAEVIEYRRFVYQTIWRDSEFTPVFCMKHAKRCEGDPPLTDDRVMELLQAECDDFCGTSGGRALCQLIFDAERDEFVGVFVPRR